MTTVVPFSVSNETDLNADIQAADLSGATNTQFVINITQGFAISSDILAINLGPGSGNSVVIQSGTGSNVTLTGNGAAQGFFDYSGSLTLKNLTITGMAAVGGTGSGGGAGLGGGLFVAAAGSATLDNVTFSLDRAYGGQGTARGGGGGLDGGAGGIGSASGGGGIGDSATGGGYGFFGQAGAGLVPGAPAGSGGANGGGGAAGEHFFVNTGGLGQPSSSGTTGGGGGGIGGASPTAGLSTGGYALNGGIGGFGGGGGAGGLAYVNGVRTFGNGGAGGFGGGGASGSGGRFYTSGGTGGFGGGGGYYANGGFGGGNNGGGGLGAGGAIFVQQGGSLTLQGGTIQYGNVRGGYGNQHNDSDPARHNDGAGFGSGIFIQGNQTTIHLAPTSGETLKISDVITDQSGSDPSNKYNAPGQGTVDVGGTGTVVFTGVDTYTGGTVIEAGATLQLGDGTTAGSITGAVTGVGTLAIDPVGANTHFSLPNVQNFAGTVRVVQGILDIASPASLGAWSISGSGTINLANFFGQSSATWGPNDTLTLVGRDASTFQAETEILHFDPGGFSGTVLTGDGSETVSVTGQKLTIDGVPPGSSTTVTGSGSELAVLDHDQLGAAMTLNAGTQLDFAVSTTMTQPVTVSGPVTFNIAAGKTVTLNGAVNNGTNPGSILVIGGGVLVLNNSTVPVTYPFTVASESDFDNAIQTVDALSTKTANAHYTITLTHDFTLTGNPWAVNLASGSLTIDGGSHTIDGANTFRGLFLNAGAVEVDNLTLAHMQARGGDGGLATGDNGGGGGGAGLGGGIFVASGAQVTLDLVNFAGDRAVGGNGGSPGGYDSGGGGGGLGTNGTGSAGGGANGGNAGIPGVPNTGGAGATFRARYAGAGGFGGGGGGAGGGLAPAGSAGAGGFGAGGGGGGRGVPVGGYLPTAGAGGGFGGGGGGGGSYNDFRNNLSAKSGGSGGFGGGAGGFHAIRPDVQAGGGGGLGAGGAIFVQDGGSLILKGGSLSGGGVAGGNAGSGTAGNGAALGSGLFIQQDSGNHAVTLAPGAGETLNIQDTIADQTGGGGTGSIVKSGAGTLVLGGANGFSGGTTVSAGILSISSDANLGNGGILALGNGTTLKLTASTTVSHAITVAGDPTFDVATGQTDTFTNVIADGATAGDVEKTGGGTLILTGTNTYSGGTVLRGGTLELGNAQAAGTGFITFASGATETLQLDSTTMPTNQIKGFAIGDLIDLAGVNFDSHGSAALAGGNLLNLVENGTTYQLHLDPAQSFAGEGFHVGKDLNGHAEVAVDDLNTGNPSVTFTGGGPAVVLDPALAVSDPAVKGAAVAISAGFQAGDTLGFNGGAPTETFTDGFTISGSYVSATHTLTLSGNASVTDYQTALRQVQYAFNPADGDPTAGGGATSRTITWAVTDGAQQISGPFDTTNLTVVHAAPAVNAGAPSVTYEPFQGAVTLDSGLTLSAPDSFGKLASATVSIGAGFLAGDTLSVASNPGNLQVVYDAQHGILKFTGVSGVGNYQAALDSVQYSSTVDASKGGQDTSRSISWQVNDGVAASAAATTSLALDVPVTVDAENDTALALYGHTISQDAAGGVLGNDVSSIFVPLTVTGVSGAGGSAAADNAVTGAFGTLTLKADGSYSYTQDRNAPANGVRTDQFTYTASDGFGVGSATLTITLDHPPVVPDATYAVAPGQSDVAGMFLSDVGASDPDGGFLAVVAVNGDFPLLSQPTNLDHGQYGDLNIFVPSTGGFYDYVPGATAAEQAALAAAPLGSHPTDAFILTVEDDNGGTTDATLSFVYERVPTAAQDEAVAIIGTPLSVDAAHGVLQNDSDPDGDALTVTAFRGSSLSNDGGNTGVGPIVVHGNFGNLTFGADGSYGYTVTSPSGISFSGVPDSSGHLHDVFTYTESDGQGGLATATLDIAFAANPLAAADAASVFEGQTITADAPGVLANDTDPAGGTLSVTSVSGAGVGTYGTLSLAGDGSYSYSADKTSAIDAAATGEHPQDVFTYSEADAQGLTTSSTLTIDIDRAPAAAHDDAAVVEGAALTADPAGVLANDSDPDGDTLTVTRTGSFTGAYGTLSLAADGSYSYVADNSTAIDAAPLGAKPVDTFTYTESDGLGGTATATLAITIDRPPVLVDDVNSVVEGKTISLDAAHGILSNDTDPDGDVITLGPLSGGDFGLFGFGPGGDYTYIAANLSLIDSQPTGQHVTDVITHVNSDGHGGTATETLTITIDRLPVAQDDTDAAVAGGTITGAASVLANDTDPDGDALTVTSTGRFTGAYGTLSLNGDGSYSYVADNAATIAGITAGTHGQDIFTYQESDGLGGSASATLTIDIDRAPVATDDDAAVVEGATVTADPAGGVLTNDSDPDRDALTVTSTGGFTGTYGTLSLAADGSYSYVADNRAAIDAAPLRAKPVDIFTYQESDGLGGTATATLAITIDRPPVLVDDVNSVVEGKTVSLDAAHGILSNDTDPDGDVITLGPLSGGDFGLFGFGPGGDYTYIAANLSLIDSQPTGQHVTDVITHVNSDGHGGTATETLTITIDRLPVAQDDTDAVVAGGTITGAASVLANDTDPDGDALTVTSTGSFTGAYGTLSLNGDGSYSYVADNAAAIAGITAGTHGQDIFTYQESDGLGGSANATLTIDIDRAPVAANDVFASHLGAAVNVLSSLLANDTDPDGDALTITSFGNAAQGFAAAGTELLATYGSLTINADGTYSYFTSASPPDAPLGSTPHELVTYTVTDGHGGTAAATLDITLDRRPTASNDSNAVLQGATVTTDAAAGVLANDTDPDGDALQAVIDPGFRTQATGSYGTLSLSSDGSYNYVADNTAAIDAAATGSHPADVFTYSALDHVFSSDATLTIAIDRLPVGQSDADAAVEGATITGAASVLANDSDPDGDALTVTAGSFTGAYGTLSLAADGTYSYVADNHAALAAAAPGGKPVDVFTYTESDGHGGTATSTLAITVDRLPVTGSDSVAVLANGTASGDLLANDTDADGDGLTIGDISGVAPFFGSDVFRADGTYSFTADDFTTIGEAPLGSHPVEVITYTETDGQGGTATGTLSITIDRPPTAIADTAAAVEGQTVTASVAAGVLSNDTDADGDALTVVSVAGGEVQGTAGQAIAGLYGHLTLNTNGSYAYVADNAAAIATIPVNTTGTDLFTYTESDGHGGLATATLAVSIVPNLPPVASADSAIAVAGATVTATAGVLVNDTDPDGDTLTVTNAGPMTGAFGHLSLNADGSYSYVADNAAAIAGIATGTHGQDVFTYQESDGRGGVASATLTLTIDRAPVLVNDTSAVMADKSVFGTSVLGNDSDPDGDGLTITGITGAGAGGQGLYGTLNFNPGGSYVYTANHAASLAEGQVADDRFTYTVADGQGASATATLDIQVTGHSGGAMEIVSYTAVESKTGDVISGALYDNSGKYTVGSSVTVPGPDNLGGSWTYTVNNIGRADVIRQDVSYSGFAYDFDYLDADTGTVYSTFYGHTGFNLGQNDKANFSGNNGLGSDGDLVIIGGKAFAIASGKYVVPEGAQASGPLLMKAVTFQAQESVTGDVISGVLFDNSGQYSVGSSVTVPGPDNAGGTWTYTVTSLADADAKHQDLSYENFAYDLTYKDADLGTVTNTLFGTAGFSSGLNDRTVNYSGNGGLGSDGDAVAVNGKDFAIASGKYVVPEPQTDAGTMQLDTFTAVESVTGDHINGVLFDNTGTYSVGSSVTVPGPDNMGGQWTYTVNSLAAADSAHQSASYNGMVYDLTYFDADTGTSYNTVFGTTGLTTGVADRTANYSGNQGLGSDGDLIRVDGSLTAIASGKYVLPDVIERRDAPPAGDGQSANLALLTNVMAGFDAPAGQGGTTPIDPSAVTQPPLLTSPHA